MVTREKRIFKGEEWSNTLAKNSRFEENIIIEIDEDISDENKEEYKLLPLELGQGYTIEHRDEDGFINVTNLCKAGNKKFNDWFRLDKTKPLYRFFQCRREFPPTL